MHRKHHAHTDIADDPHSPAVNGWFNVQLRNLAMYRRAAHDQANVEKYAKDLARTRADRCCSTTRGWACCSAWRSWSPGSGGRSVCWPPSSTSTTTSAGSAAINAIGHHFGRRPYENSATNLQWLALITAGEGLHNNHHAAPTSAKLAHRWYEIDLGWFVIKPLTWMRLAKVRLSELRLAAASSASRVAQRA